MTDQFRALGVSDAVCNVLSAQGIEAPFPIQSVAIPEALRGGDVLAKSPTGSGKTLAFAIPIVELLDPGAGAVAALVLVPTRELAVQVTEAIELVGRARKIRVASVYGGVPLRKQADDARGAQVVVATPGRLQDLIERKLVNLDSVRVLVLDEADRMLDMGFKPQVDRIVKRMPADRQTMFFSATLDGEVGELAHRYTQLPSRFEAELPEGSASGDVDHRFVPVTPENKVQTLVELLPTTAGWRSCSCGRRPAPTGSSRSSAGTTSTRSRSTATRPRPSASGRLPASTRARCARSSPPTSRRAGSTSTTSPT